MIGYLKSEMSRLIELHDEQAVDFLNCGNNISTPGNDIIYSSFPNPARDITHIVYELQYDAHVRVDLYNFMGQHVKLMLEMNVSSGPHSFDLDVSDLPRGLYFYEINTSGQKQLAKLMVQ